MSALATISNKEGLIQRVCVARDEQVGVYGFVFHRGRHPKPARARDCADMAQTESGSRKSSTISCT